MIGIYKITSPTGKIYIGQSVNIERRFREYKRTSKMKTQPRLRRSLVKYGYDSHLFEVVEICEISQMNNKERYYQELYDCVGENGLNCELCRSDNCNKIVSEHTKEKLRISCSNISEETRRKLSLAGYRNRHTQETKDLISRITKGRKHTDEAKKKMSEALKGKPSRMLGKKHTNETKYKISKSHKGKKMSAETRLKLSNSNFNAKRVLDMSTNIEYSSVLQASKITGIGYGKFAKLLRTGKFKHL